MVTYMMLMLFGMQSLYGAYNGFEPIPFIGVNQFQGYPTPSAPPPDSTPSHFPVNYYSPIQNQIPPVSTDYVALEFFTQLGLSTQDIQTLNNSATAIQVASKVQQYAVIRGQLEVLQQMGVDTKSYQLGDFTEFNYEAWVAQIQELQRKVKRSPLESPKQPAAWSWQENLTNGFAQIPTYTLNRFWQRVTLGFVGFFIPIVWNIPMYSPATCAMMYALSSLVDHSTYVQERKCPCARHQKSFKCMALYINAFILPFLLWYVLNETSIAC